MPSSSDHRGTELTFAGVMLSIVASVFLGLGPSTAKMAFDGGADDFAVQGLRFATTAVLLLPIVWLRGGFPPEARAMWRRILVMGGLTATGVLGYMAATRYISVPLTTLIFFTYPPLIGVIAWLFRTEGMSAAKIAGIAVAFAGVALIIGAAPDDPDLFGILLAFMGAFSVAVLFVVAVPALHLLGSVRVFFSNSVIALAIYGAAAPVAIALGHVPSLPAGTWGWSGIVLHAGVMTVGITMLLASIHRIGSVNATVVNNLEPVVSMAAAALLFGQYLGGLQLAGAALVIGGILVLQLRKRRRPAAVAATEGGPAEPGGR